MDKVGRVLYSHGNLVLMHSKEAGVFTKVIGNASESLSSSGIDNKELVESLRFVYNTLVTMDSPGYLNHNDLTRFPVINRVFWLYLHEICESSSLGLSPFNGENRYKLCKWSYNIILLALYERLLLTLNELVDGSDEYADCKCLCDVVYKSLDTSIKVSLKRHGISITREVKCGYDTEFKARDGESVVDLLSAQFAICGRVVIKVPTKEPYKLSSLHTVTGKLYPSRLKVVTTRVQGDSKKPRLFVYLDGAHIEFEINLLIDRIRKVKYSNYDDFTKGLNIVLTGYLNKGSDTANVLGSLESPGGENPSVGNLVVSSDLMNKIMKGGFSYYYLRRTPGSSFVYDNILSKGAGYGLNDIIARSDFETRDSLDAYVGLIFTVIEGVLKLFGMESELRAGDMVQSEGVKSLPNIVLPESKRISKNNTNNGESYDLIVKADVATPDVKSLSRTTIKRGLKVSVSITRSLTVVCFFSRADIPLLKD